MIGPRPPNDFDRLLVRWAPAVAIVAGLLVLIVLGAD
jgi:hypothetical protein